MLRLLHEVFRIRNHNFKKYNNSVGTLFDVMSKYSKMNIFKMTYVHGYYYRVAMLSSCRILCLVSFHRPFLFLIQIYNS